LNRPVSTFISNIHWLLRRADLVLACAALAAMVVIAIIEIVLRPTWGRGIDNAPVLVQHLGLVMTMFGALAGAHRGHLTKLGNAFEAQAPTGSPSWAARAGPCLAAVVCGLLAVAGARLVHSEMTSGQTLAYGMPLWWWQLPIPIGFAALGWRLAAPVHPGALKGSALALLWVVGGAALAWSLDGRSIGWGWILLPLLGLAAGVPIFAVLGCLAVLLFATEAQPIASVALSHYQITVNPSLPALPLFTLAGLIYARTGAAARLGLLFQRLFGGGQTGTVIAAAVLCSIFTAFTGGSGVTILALGGLLVPMLLRAGYPRDRSIGLVTSASALGVLLAPSVPLIMVAILARVPLNEMFLAGVVPAIVMVLCLLTVGGFLRPTGSSAPAQLTDETSPGLGQALWAARWELGAPVVAVGGLLSGLATPLEGAAMTACYAAVTQAWVHREGDWRLYARCLADVAMIIGGVMLILGMALALTNYMVDAGIPDVLTDGVREWIPNRWVFLVLLCLLLFVAAAFMEIYAAIVVLVPLLLPLAKAYGIEPVHFGVLFLAAMEVGFLCPPAGMNLYFAASMFKRPLSSIARSVAPAVLAIFVGTLLIAAVPALSTFLPNLVLRSGGP
jgi:C4-dicarboxylate transporter, DctM subunit